MIALSMGEKGQIVRLLAAKYGGHLTFAAMSPERASAPGQPDIGKLVGLYNYRWAERGGRRVDMYGRCTAHFTALLGSKRVAMGCVAAAGRAAGVQQHGCACGAVS